MDAEAPNTPTMPGEAAPGKIDNAIRALHEKKPIPEIDFTLHTMENGTQVNTRERVCKGISPLITDT